MATDFAPRDITVRNGRTVHLRAILPSDEEEILQAFERLGAQSRYMRFMHAVREANVARLRTVLASFPAKGLGIAATVPAEDGIDIVGTATFILDGKGESCEFAVSVVDAWAGAGLGRTLMAALVEAARQRGLREMVGYVMAENQPMLRLAGKLGFATRRDPDDHSQRICCLALQDGAGKSPAT